MDIDNYKQLQINGRLYTSAELLEGAIDELRVEPDGKLIQFIKDWISDSKTLTIKTSGSTGSPKEIEFSKKSMIKSAIATASFFGLKPDYKALLCLPIDYIAGKMMVVRAFVAGLNLIPVKPSANPLAEIIEPAEFAAMTPMQVFQSFELPDGIKKLNSISTLIIGGGAINKSLADKIQQLSNYCWQSYGMTETLTHVAVRRLTGENISEQYFGLPGFEFSTNQASCLRIKTPYPESRSIQTNDVVLLYNATSFTFKGRFDFVINSGGVKIFPEDIERKLDPYIRQRFVISSLNDEIIGEKPVLVVEGDIDKEFSLPEISKQAFLTKIETPRQIITLESFPETNTGKINRLSIKHLLSLQNYKGY